MTENQAEGTFCDERAFWRVLCDDGVDHIVARTGDDPFFLLLFAIGRWRAKTRVKESNGGGITMIAGDCATD